VRISILQTTIIGSLPKPAWLAKPDWLVSLITSI